MSIDHDEIRELRARVRLLEQKVEALETALETALERVAAALATDSGAALKMGGGP